MNEPPSRCLQPLRVFYLEDNPLIIFHVEQMIEDLGHVFVGSTDRFEGIERHVAAVRIDVALVDIDLADGSTGPQAAAWLQARGIPAIFVTGQERTAAQHRDVCTAVIAKPILRSELAERLESLRSRVK
ncbi:MAG TPA: response regulator [Lichenihabitans sp.]|jgi:CheY-like chemotaxis protein|nr:response regulator [Lichenihabitans sp.]